MSFDLILLMSDQSGILVSTWAGFWSLVGRYWAGSLHTHNLWNSLMKGRTRSGSSVTRTFSMLHCTAVSVQLREPVMSSRPSTTANLWCMCTEKTSLRTLIPTEQWADGEETYYIQEWIRETSSVTYESVNQLWYLLWKHRRMVKLKRSCKDHR